MAFNVEFAEDGTATVLARITARQGSGEATGVAGEGNWLQQDDLSAIACKVFDLDGDDPETAVATPTVSVADAVLDEPVTSSVLWTEDAVGYNFLHDLPASAFPDGGHRYRVEYKFTLGGGSVFHAVFEGPARPVWGS